MNAAPDLRSGLFVALEGGDGAGKSTQAVLLQAYAERQGRVVRMTRQPGGTALGMTIRALVLHGEAMAPRAEALLFAADKAQHVEELIRPALARGEVVITDRYVDSSIAYQGAGRDLGADEVRELNLWAVAGVLPDLTILLDVTTGDGRHRVGEERDRMESEPEEFHHAVRSHFLALAQADPARYLVVDAALPIETIHRRITDRLAELGL